MRFLDKCVVITGAASGLGRATAILMAEEGANLVLVDLARAGLQSLQAELDKKPGDVQLLAGDVSKSETAIKAAKLVGRRHGAPDVLFNNAGINPVGSLIETDEATWDRIIGVNLKGPYLFCHHLAPMMVEAGRGSIINTASIAAFRASYKESAYGISKAGLVHLTKTLARDLAEHNIRVNALCPGFLPNVTSDRAAVMTKAEKQARSDRARAAIPLGREGSYDEYARFVAFLADEQYSYMTGACVQVDGALYA